MRLRLCGDRRFGADALRGRPEKTKALRLESASKRSAKACDSFWRTPIIVQTMTLDFVATFFASANQLLPIFATDILKVGAHGFGFLGAAQAAGAYSPVW